MDSEKLKYQIGANIAAYRKNANMTQATLAERINYSDKAVSKWERGESVPDVTTLVMLAEQFGVTVNELLVDPDALPENSDSTLEKAMSQVSEKALKRKANKNVILALSSTLVWFVALLGFVITSSFDLLQPFCMLPFVYDIPANDIVLLSLRSAWRDIRWNRALISVIVWGSLMSIHATILMGWDYNFWKLYLLGIPGQLAVFLWFRLFRSPAREEKTENG